MSRIPGISYLLFSNLRQNYVLQHIFYDICTHALICAKICRFKCENMLICYNHHIITILPTLTESGQLLQIRN